MTTKSVREWLKARPIMTNWSATTYIFSGDEFNGKFVLKSTVRLIIQKTVYTVLAFA